MAAIVIIICRGRTDPTVRAGTQVVGVDDAIVVIVIVFVLVATSILVAIGGLCGLPPLVSSDACGATVVDILYSISVLIVSCTFNDDLRG